MVVFQSVYGVDFSGAANAGKHIWIANGVVTDNVLTIKQCFPASALPNSSNDRQQAITALRTHIANSTHALFGLDFPFSLHQSQLHSNTWTDFALAFAQRYPTADAFRAACGGRGNELRRQTDLDTGTPFAAGNLRMYRQTYYGIRDLLAPLVRSQTAVIFPMQPPEGNKPVVIEVCPAVTLRRLQARLPNYKEHGAESIATRQRIMAALEGAGVTFVDTALRARVLDNARGDALDSVIAAYGAAATFCNGAFQTQPSLLELLEGKVYG
ncbi:MAG: DUF429 domain-containing protein [Chloroflexota bacterium]|nr:DUF429 domain-containing protein [Chloroflexota bacterium]